MEEGPACLSQGQQRPDTYLEFCTRQEEARFTLLLLEGQKPFSILAIFIEKLPREKVVLNTIKIQF